MNPHFYEGFLNKVIGIQNWLIRAQKVNSIFKWTSKVSKWPPRVFLGGKSRFLGHFNPRQCIYELYTEIFYLKWPKLTFFLMKGPYYEIGPQNTQRPLPFDFIEKNLKWLKIEFASNFLFLSHMSLKYVYRCILWF